MGDPGGLDRLPDGPVRRMFAAARQHDLDAMCAQFADDYVNITPTTPPAVSGEEHKSGLTGPLSLRGFRT